MHFNVDGSFGKNRLRDYSNVFAAVIGKNLLNNVSNFYFYFDHISIFKFADAISRFSESSAKTLRAAFQRQKKKFFKQTTRNKTKNNDDENLADSFDRE